MTSFSMFQSEEIFLDMFEDEFREMQVQYQFEIQCTIKKNHVIFTNLDIYVICDLFSLQNVLGKPCNAVCTKTSSYRHRIIALYFYLRICPYKPHFE